MLTEHFVVATESVKPPITHLSSNLKDVGVFIHEFQPQLAVRQGFKKSSVAKNCLGISETHVFAAQAGKAIINVYNREKNNQESAVPFPQKITSLAYAQNAAVLVLGTQDGRLILWEIATGRISNSSASHIEAVTLLEVSLCGGYIISASPDSSVHVWSIRSLVDIDTGQNEYGGGQSGRDPVSTFSHHRSAIDALAIGHAQQASSNIVASVSEDKTCYVWNLESSTILRTVLLLQNVQCAIFDPADRAVYFGSSDGSVQTVDVLGQTVSAASSILGTSQRDATTATQLTSKSHWAITGSSTSDPAQCITISYDGTSLITGHYSGILIEWDVGKRRMGRQLSTLTGQAVTNIRMMQPIGLTADNSRSQFIIPTVVKPRLDLSQATNNGQAGVSSSVPADYALHVQVLRKQIEFQHETDVAKSFALPEISQAMLDDAIQSLVANKVSRAQIKQAGQTTNGGEELQDSEEVQKELAALRARLARRDELDQVRVDKHIARMKRREALGLQKRQAFFAAKKEGKNGDEAMKSFAKLEQEIDEESDQEAMAEKAGARQIDTVMKG